MTQGGQSQGGLASVWAIDSRPEVLAAIAACGGDDFRVTTFKDARRAILNSRQALPDLVVLGLAPNTVDPQALLALREEFEELERLPAIAIFDEGQDQLVEALMAEGLDDAVAIDRLAMELPRRIRWRLGKRQHHTSPVPRPAGQMSLQTFDLMARVIEASPNAIVAARRSGEIELFNRAAVNILGWTEEEALGMDVRKLYPDGGAERIMQMMLTDRQGPWGQIDSVREVVVNAGGELIPVEISAALIEDEGHQVATVGIFTDLRQRMTLEERLQEAMEALEQTQRQAVIVEVAGAAAHELNQPLTSLLGYVDFLRRQVDKEHEWYRPVTVIYDEASRIADAVRKIGRIARYRTRDYAGGDKIVDLDASSAAHQSAEPARKSHENVGESHTNDDATHQ